MENGSQIRPTAHAYIFTPKARSKITSKVHANNRCDIRRGGVTFRFMLWFNRGRVQWVARQKKEVIAQGLAETVFEACEAIEREIGGEQWARLKLKPRS